MIKIFRVGVLGAVHALVMSCIAGAQQLADYEVIWDSPSIDCHGSMPIGNGDIGANVWVEPNGDLCFYLSKTDAIDEYARFVKLGKMRLRLDPNPFQPGAVFRQRLDLENGIIHIRASNASTGVTTELMFYVDANRPVLRIEGTCTAEVQVNVDIEPWRKERVPVKWDRSFTGLGDRSSGKLISAYPLVIEPDRIVEGRPDSLLWFHRNDTSELSVWADTLKQQGLEGFIKQSSDPLHHLTFGALVKGDGLISQSSTSLRSRAATKQIDVSVSPLTAQTATEQQWIDQLERMAAEQDRGDREIQRNEHQRWWREFWDRSWIRIAAKPGDDAFVVSQAYALQTWMTACGGRGRLPIKFNGSIFTVDGIEGGRNCGPDYRAWGSAYWFQNTRLPYWPLMTAGHPELMQPIFRMYMDALPLAKFRTRSYYGFDGASFPETMFFWGAYTNQDYGWKRKPEMTPEQIVTPHIQYLWSGGIELTAMMLEYYRHTLDREFLSTTLLPFAREIAAFYDQRYPRDERGKLIIEPANAQEDLWACRNPMPEVAGLRFMLPQLIKLAADAHDKQLYQRLLEATPEFPTGTSKDGHAMLLPAELGSERRRGNCEKPECYAIFPFRHYGVGLPDLELARETFRQSPKSMRGEARINGWIQDPIFAACVGDVAGAKQRIIDRSKTFNQQSRFPAFWGPNFDWTPDQCHGGVNMSALQAMLLQTDPSSDAIHLFPAWPASWDCHFKLHAPGQTVVQGVVKSGKLIELHVTPESRRKDVINHLPAVR